MTLVRLIARPMLASIFVIQGYSTVRHPEPYAERAKPLLDKLEPLFASATSGLPVKADPVAMVRANGIVHLACGAMLATGRRPRTAALILAGSLVPTTLGGHRYWDESDPEARAAQKTQFLKNVAMLGGLLLASVDTAGKPSIGWRARRQAGLAKQRASDLLPG
jgi:putative oxidoreductase